MTRMETISYYYIVFSQLQPEVSFREEKTGHFIEPSVYYDHQITLVLLIPNLKKGVFTIEKALTKITILLVPANI